ILCAFWCPPGIGLPADVAKPARCIWLKCGATTRRSAPGLSVAGQSGPCVELSRKLSAGDAHVARHRRLRASAIDDEIMTSRLAGDRRVDGGVQEFVRLRRAQWGAQIRRIV